MFNHYVHATRPRPAMEGTPATLRDGSTVLIRQVRRTDAPLLADGFARLSARSRQLRFLGHKKMLSAAELRYLTDVDHHDHEAIGALSPAEGAQAAVEDGRRADRPQPRHGGLRGRPGTRDEYSLDWWFRSVDDGAVLAWP
jgi:hypothetical protein